jgi:hypothetical protein
MVQHAKSLLAGTMKNGKPTEKQGQINWTSYFCSFTYIPPIFFGLDSAAMAAP